MHLIKSRTTALLAAGAVAVAAALGTASTASAQSGFHTIIPYVAPRMDVALGANFPLAQRDSSGISFAESWRMVPAPDGHVYIVNRLREDGVTEEAIDTQDTLAGGPSDPGEGKAVGTSPLDRSSTQQWKVVHHTFGVVYSHSTIRNRHTNRFLTWNGTGAVPAYSQKESESVLSHFKVRELP
jgi:hypothetical protein